MSWQTYMDDHLMCDIEGNHLTSAAILGHDGSVWAQIASFPKVAPTKYRGSLGTLCQIGTCLGIIASLILGSPSENDPHWWRTILYIASVPGFILSLGMQFAVDSPRWLCKGGQMIVLGKASDNRVKREFEALAKML